MPTYREKKLGVIFEYEVLILLSNYINVMNGIFGIDGIFLM